MRAFLTLIVALAAVGCSDALAPDAAPRLGLQLSVIGPAAISAEEQSALGDAFDRVDQYTVTVVDSVTLELLADTTITIASGQSIHTLDVAVPDDTFGRTVTITLVAYQDGVELYRSVTTVTLREELDQIPVELEIRYTGPGVRGTVRDDAGNGLAGVTIGLYEGEAILETVQTEPDGTYLFLDLAPGSYQVQATPLSGTLMCPANRDLTVASTDDAIIADFRASVEFCGTRILVLSGGDVDDTGAVAAVLAGNASLQVSTFFHVNQLPGIDFLRQHDVVLLFMNGLFDESSALGDEVAQYVTEGGNLVLGSFYWQGALDSGLGSVGWGALESMDPFRSSGGALYVSGALDTGTIAVHPLTAGLTTLSATSYWGGVTALQGVTQVVAQWTDGTPLIGYRVLAGGQRIVGVSLFPAAGVAATGDVQVLWANAVAWAGQVSGRV